MSRTSTIEKYTNFLLKFFSNVEDYTGNKIPIAFFERDKIFDLDSITEQNLYNGNYNLVPRSALSFESLSYAQERQINRNIDTYASPNDLNFIENTRTILAKGVPYNISYNLSILTRGFTSATFIMEQIATRFNPYYEFSLKVTDFEDPKTIRLKLEDISFEPQDEDKFDNNEILVECTFILYGYLYSNPVDVPSVMNLNLDMNSVTNSNVINNQGKDCNIKIIQTVK